MLFWLGEPQFLLTASTIIFNQACALVRHYCNQMVQK